MTNLEMKKLTPTISVTLFTAVLPCPDAFHWRYNLHLSWFFSRVAIYRYKYVVRYYGAIRHILTYNLLFHHACFIIETFYYYWLRTKTKSLPLPLLAWTVETMTSTAASKSMIPGGGLMMSVKMADNLLLDLFHENFHM